MRKTSEYLLKASKNFCLMPWNQLHIWPNGAVYPCCMAKPTLPFGRYKSGNLKELWNSKEFKKIRKNMLSDKPSEACTRCYKFEEVGLYTLRQSSLNQFGRYIKEIESTTGDGVITEPKIRYLDVRFSNICNFRCRTCGVNFSSSWYEDHKILYGDPKQPKVLSPGTKGELWSELSPHLKDVETAYFAGGEPIVCDEHYKVLDHWVSIGNLDVNINYTTNFSTLSFQRYNVLDYWKKFKNITVSASLDDSGTRAEYSRKGTDWKKIEANRKLMIEKCPTIYFEITPTISIFNVWHFPDFHLDWIKRGLLEINSLRLNILTDSVYLQIKNLPKTSKILLIGKYQKYLEQIIDMARQRDEPYFKVQEGYESVIANLRKSVPSKKAQMQISMFIFNAKRIDNLRKESLFQAIPELKHLITGRVSNIELSELQ